MVTLTPGPIWKIAVYGRDHGVPHYPIEGPGFRCSVSIATGEIIIGNALAGVLRQARAWAESNRAVLASIWQELNG